MFNVARALFKATSYFTLTWEYIIQACCSYTLIVCFSRVNSVTVQKKKNHNTPPQRRLSDLQGLRVTETRSQSSIFLSHLFPRQESAPLVTHEISAGMWLGTKEHGSAWWKSHCLKPLPIFSKCCKKVSVWCKLRLQYLEKYIVKLVTPTSHVLCSLEPRLFPNHYLCMWQWDAAQTYSHASDVTLGNKVCI